MNTTPKIRNKPPRREGGQWVHWTYVSPTFGPMKEIEAWRYGWDGASRLDIARVDPAMNVEGLMWFCTDMDWLRAQVQYMQGQLNAAANMNGQAIQNMYGCNCCRGRNAASPFAGIFGGLL